MNERKCHKCIENKQQQPEAGVFPLLSILQLRFVNVHVPPEQAATAVPATETNAMLGQTQTASNITIIIIYIYVKIIYKAFI